MALFALIRDTFTADSLKACAPCLLSRLRLPSLTRKLLIILSLTDEDKERQPAQGPATSQIRAVTFQVLTSLHSVILPCNFPSSLTSVTLVHYL